ncbi:hypothetical protein Tco_0798147 [Tanacetum coccineum]
MHTIECLMKTWWTTLLRFLKFLMKLKNNAYHEGFSSLTADDARQWWINEGDGKITTWEEQVEKFFCKFYPESYDGEDEMLDEGDNWGIDPLEFISRIQRISLTGFPVQSVGSYNTDVLDSPCLLVLITGTSQSRQHGKSESDSYYLSD